MPLTPAPIRQHLRKYLTPKIADRLVFETGVNARQPVPEFGTLHPDQNAYAGYRFCYASPKDDQGLVDTLVYAAPREGQDEYNWEWTEADIGGTKFSAVQRTYVTLRDDFVPYTPAQGASMPDSPTGRFGNASTYRLAERTQRKIGDEELASIFVIDVQVFIRTVPLANVTLSPEQGRAKSSITYFYCRGDIVPDSGGQAIEDLADDEDDPYWGQQTDAVGTFRELNSLSENWFAVTESTSIAGNGEAPGTGNPARTRTRDYPTPSVLDYIVREVNADPGNLDYGTPHYDTATYPAHVLSYKRPVAGSGGLLYEFFYTAPRANQDAYNARHSGNDVLTRIYVFPRANYPANLDSAVAFGANDPQYGTRYQFTHEELIDVDQELHGVFVMVRRFYQQLVKTRFYDDDELDAIVKEVTTITEFNPAATAPPSVAGVETEVRPVNTFYNETISRTMLTQAGAVATFPRQLTTLPTMVNKSLPPVLKAVNLVSVYAIASSSGAPTAYDEDFYFDPIMVDPFPGPYSGRIIRFLTDDPFSVMSQYAIDQWVEVADTIPLVAGYWFASNDGNTAKALAKQITLRPSVHAEVPINGIETLAIVQQKTSLPMTPGFRNFEKMSTITTDVNPQKTRYGLYIVSIYQANISGVYGGTRVDFDEAGGSNGAGDGVTDTTPPPVVNTGTISADNRTVTGTATPGAAIIATYAGVELGKVMSNAQGSYSITLQEPIFTDPVDLLINARKGGVLSGALVVTTRDLAPGTPTASITGDLTTVSGNSQKGATITIGMTEVPQVETATVAGTVTSDGQVELTLTSAVVTNSPVAVLVDVVNGWTPTQVALAFRQAMTQRADINDKFIVSGTGTSIVLTRRVLTTASLYNDGTLNMAIIGSNGVTDTPTSSNTTFGLGPVTTTASTVDGTWSYFFSPALPSGTELSITASDLGGTSPPVVVKADADPPDITATPAFDTGSYTDIIGAVTVGGVAPGTGAVTVTAYLGDVSLDTAVNDVAGDFTIVLPAPRYRGEVITLIASLTSDMGVKSQAVNVTAPNLNLPIPAFTESAGEYIGSAPEPASYAPAELYKLVVRYEPTLEEVEFDVFPSNNEFAFDFDDFTGDIGNQNGERYEIFFRFDLDPGAGTYLVDGEPSYINSPVIPLPGAVIAQFPPAAFYPNERRWDANWLGAQALGPGTPDSGSYVLARARFNTTVAASNGVIGNLMPFPYDKSMAITLPNMVEGSTVLIKFPGQDLADIGPAAYTGPILFGNVSFPFEYRTAGQALNTGIWGSGRTASTAGWYQNATMYTRETVKANQPARLRIIVTAPDGRVSETIWTRNESYPWTDPVYSNGMTS